MLCSLQHWRSNRTEGGGWGEGGEGEVTMAVPLALTIPAVICQCGPGLPSYPTAETAMYYMLCAPSPVVSRHCVVGVCPSCRPCYSSCWDWSEGEDNEVQSVQDMNLCTHFTTPPPPFPLPPSLPPLTLIRDDHLHDGAADPVSCLLPVSFLRHAGLMQLPLDTFMVTSSLTFHLSPWFTHI